jgi:hypothetical protein
VFLVVVVRDEVDALDTIVYAACVSAAAAANCTARARHALHLRTRGAIITQRLSEPAAVAATAVVLVPVVIVHELNLV